MTEAGSIAGLTQLLYGRPPQEAFNIWMRNVLIEEAWYRCDRGDRLLGFAESVGIIREDLVPAVVECMRPILAYAYPREQLAAHAMDVALAWHNKKATYDMAASAIDEVAGSYVGTGAASHHREAIRLMLTRPSVAVGHVACAEFEREEHLALRAGRSPQEALAEGRRAQAASLAASANVIREQIPIAWILDGAGRLA